MLLGEAGLDGAGVGVEGGEGGGGGLGEEARGGEEKKCGAENCELVGDVCHRGEVCGLREVRTMQAR